ncbi:unnamed protein product [Paramecium sonneborni]|uniref:Uncharacterized protein n=1 Tax=Paramecium sonneborni TaxID=65129 RepID=A0A8S1MD26_9CILI|nr:unnamed protein product [Paramecium sonneborni]
MLSIIRQQNENNDLFGQILVLLKQLLIAQHLKLDQHVTANQHMPGIIICAQLSRNVLIILQQILHNVFQ